MWCGVREGYSRVCHNGVTRFMNVLDFRYFSVSIHIHVYHVMNRLHPTRNQILLFYKVQKPPRILSYLTPTVAEPTPRHFLSKTYMNIW